MRASGLAEALTHFRSRLRPWRRQRWFLIAAGYAAAFLTGIAFARWLRSYGDWHDGLAWERDLLRAMRGALPAWWDAVLVLLAWLGTNITLIPLTACLVLWLVFKKKRYHDAVYLAVVQLGSFSLNPALKFLYGRSRPDILAKRGWYGWTAYPSGHAIASVAVLTTIAVVLWRAEGWRWPTYVVLPLLAVSLFSRVYLGMHWPTDVIGGALVGAVWLLFTYLAFRDDRRRGGQSQLVKGDPSSESTSR